MNGHWPQAERRSTISEGHIGARRKVGKYVAVAHSAADFEDFYVAVMAAARKATSNPGRLLVYSHFVNATSVALKPLPAGCLPLVDGYILEGVCRGNVTRLIALSSQLTPYQLLTTAATAEELETTVQQAIHVLEKNGHLTLDAVAKCLPEGLVQDHRSAAYLLSHLVYRGFANSLDAAASTIERVTAVS